MATTVWIKDRAHLIRHVAALLRRWGTPVDDQKIKVEWYCFDQRIGWDTHIVTLDGYPGVIGFTDGIPT